MRPYRQASSPPAAATPRRSVCAPGDVVFILPQTRHGRNKDGGVWWFPQGPPEFDPQLPHQGKRLADALKQAGWEVHELPRGVDVRAEIAGGDYDAVLLLRPWNQHTRQEVFAYQEYVAAGGSRCTVRNRFWWMARPAPTKNLFIKYAVVSVTGGVQPATLQRAPGDSHFENGLAGRILMAAPPKERKVWGTACVAESVLRRIEKVFAGLLALDFGTDRIDSPAPRDLTLTKDVRRVWVDICNEHSRLQFDGTGTYA